MKILTIKNLSVEFETLRGRLKAVDHVSFELHKSETLGIVGESGCGKSLTSLAVMGLLPPNAIVTADALMFKDVDLLTANEKTLRDLRGRSISMIFQDPMTSLNPCFTVAFQMDEILRVHNMGTKSQRKERVLELLQLVGIPVPESCMKRYPHELSGGMIQRVMIAMAMACRPDLLIADEPTTALDVTMQAQILALLQELQRDYQMGLILISHDIGVVSQMADRIQVMYAGQVIESAPARSIINEPQHPYTHGLLKSLPNLQESGSGHKQRLNSIKGVVPDLIYRPTGCQFHPRCQYAQDRCQQVMPAYEQTQTNHSVKCFFPLKNSKIKEQTDQGKERKSE